MPELASHAPLWSAAVGAVARSDFIRVQLLAAFGGVWADATLMCTGDVFAWLESVGVDGFFVFDRKQSGSWPVDPFRDLRLPYSSWFVAASRGSAVASQLADVISARLDACYVSGVPPDYFWLHQSIDCVAKAAGTAGATALAAMPLLESRAPHLLEFETSFVAIATDESRRALDGALRVTPMQKLSYKVLAPKLMAALADVDWSSNLGELLARAGPGVVESARVNLEAVDREELLGASTGHLAEFESLRKKELWANWPDVYSGSAWFNNVTTPRLYLRCIKSAMYCC
ncbi:hypothetical protein T492DRAFT_959550 [Pavlovales sp. CCMP2436]|nr:hypothetical protein T492DRAFT_959550 [Pavlovales sp. CCMP2436]